MGRSTRFFGARVLRSGRRVWTGPTTDKVSDGKKSHCSQDAVHVQASPKKPTIGVAKEDEELVDFKNRGNEAVGCNSFKVRKKIRVDVDEGVNVKKRIEISKKIEETKEVEEIVDKMYGLVYRRKGKRKRGAELEGMQYFRRKKRRGTHKKDDVNVSNGLRKRLGKLAIVVGSCGSRRGNGSGSSYGVISSLLHSILRYSRKADMRLGSLCTFVCSEPIVHVFAVHGIRFLQDFSPVGEPGSCLITGVRSSIPLFYVDFASLPFLFLHLHSSLSLWSARSFHFSETVLSSPEEKKEEINPTNEFSSSIPLKRDQIGCESVVGIGTTVVALPALGLNNIGGQSVHIKSGCKIRKTRNSRRNRRRPPGSLMQRSNGVPPNTFRSRQNGVGYPSQVSTRQLRSSNQRKVPSDVNELKDTSLELSQKIGASSCCANILVIESNKCYRVEGALTTLELSQSNQWCLVVRKGGVKQYSITAQKVMRPCSTNRLTHDIVWSRDDDLKLEFHNRQDWLIFKELYKECFERNLKMPGQSGIPVPRVVEVVGYGEISCLPFVRPCCYITVKDDELARALKKKAANYDMDSDDEEWIHKFNSGYYTEIEGHENLSADRFELMIDALEKAYYFNPDVLTNAEAANSIFPDRERKVVEAVYGHWILKRKLKRAALIGAFQFHQPMKAQPISKFNSRKKRSFKRHGVQDGRGKQRKFFHAFVAEQDAIEQQKILKFQEAKARLERLECLASQKRQRAQELFENADLAVYKALMAVRISEAAQLTESTHVAASYILG